METTVTSHSTLLSGEITWRWRCVATLLFLVITMPFFLWGARLQGDRVNTDPSKTDQSAYLREAQAWGRARAQGMPYVTERNRMPGYLWALSHAVSPEAKLRAAFKQGKRFSQGVAALCYGLVTFLGFSLLAPLGAAIFSLLAGFHLLVFRAPLVQCEVLFYTIFLLTICAMVALLRRPSLWGGAAVGALAALGYLTKASMLAAVYGFIILLLVGALAQLRRGRQAIAPWAGATAGFLLVFIALLSPYLMENKERFGQYFYNVNSTFYIWYESWEQAKQGTRAHGDRLHWPEMPAEQLPSARRYLEKHGVEGIVERLHRGSITLWGRLWDSYGYMPFVLVLGALAVLLCIVRWSRARSYLREFWLPISGALSMCVGFMILAVWYQPIVEGPRIALTVLMPILLALLLVVERLLLSQPASVRLYLWASGTLLLAVVTDIVLIFDERIVRVYGGF